MSRKHATGTIFLLSFILLSLCFTHALAGLLDFCGAAPFTYDHATGGGAYNDGSVGRYKDKVESLEGGDFHCGDWVSFFVQGNAWPYTDPELIVSQTYAADSTGQSGVAFIDTRVFVNCNDQSVQNGAGNGGTDTACNTKNQLTVTFNEVLPTNFYTKKAVIQLTWKLSGLSKGDNFVVRIDGLLGCNGGRATGNLLSKTMSAQLGNGATVNVGTQTVPLKVKGVQPVCPPPIITLRGVDFTADATVSAPGIAGTTDTNYIYSWSQGVISQVPTKGKSNKKTSSYTTSSCDTERSAIAAFSVGSCGCEVSHVDTTQPQLFYDAQSNYYASSPVSTALNGVSVLQYNRNGNADGVSKLYLRKSDSTIVRADWSDGTVISYSNVVYGDVLPQSAQNVLDSVISTTDSCYCNRLLDIVLVFEQTSDLSLTDFAASVSFATDFANSFSISPTNVNFGIVTYDSSGVMNTPLSLGVSSNNVQSSIAALTCSGKKVCGKASASAGLDSGISVAQNMLKNSLRYGKAAPVIVVIGKSVLSNTGINAAQPTQVVLVVTSAPKVTLPSSTLLFVRQSSDDLGGGGVSDVVGDICSSSPSPCGAYCCGTCDSTCGICIPVDSCPTEQSCQFDWIVQNQCCVKNTAVQKCQPRSGQCEVASCDAVSGNCSYTNFCQPSGPNDCFTNQCVNGQCVRTPKTYSGSACQHAECINGVFTVSAVECPKNTSCFTYTCDPVSGCVAAAVPPPSSTSCQTVNCDPEGGYTVNDIPNCSPCTAPSDPCTKAVFNNSACTNVPKCAPPQNGCYIGTCSNGNCGYTRNACDDSNPCTVDSCDDLTGSCIHTNRSCGVSDACVVFTCDASNGDCKSVSTTCDDGISCTRDSCDPNSGCVFTPVDSVCMTGDGCVAGICDTKKGCMTEPVTCPASDKFCVQSTCSSRDGCLNVSRACNTTTTAPDAVHCVLAVCNEEQTKCADAIVECNSNIITAAIVGSTIGTASVIGIVVGAALFVGASSGGAYVWHNQMNSDSMSAVRNNPLFEAKKTHHDNPLHAT